MVAGNGSRPSADSLSGNVTVCGVLAIMFGPRLVDVQSHVRPSTIRGWLSRGAPKGNPFPPPDRRYRGRSYWRRATIEAWRGRQEQARR